MEHVLHPYSCKREPGQRKTDMKLSKAKKQEIIENLRTHIVVTTPYDRTTWQTIASDMAAAVEIALDLPVNEIQNPMDEEMNEWADRYEENH